MSWKQVRPILDCLCQIFSFYGFTTINPTQLYRAKFDRDEVTRPLWKLIHQLLHFQIDHSAQIRSAKIFDQTTSDKLVDQIKNELNNQGYQYDHIRSLDSKMEHGSRSLLVCFAWLLHHLKFIDRCVENCLRTIYPESSEESMKTLLKSALQINEELRKHFYSNSNGTTESFIEFEKEFYQLDLFRFWFENETTFWKWMESVLDDDTPHPHPHPQVNIQQLEAEREKFHAAVDTLDNALIRLEQLWISNDDRRAIGEDMKSIITSIDQQISSLFSQLSNFPKK